MHIGLLSFPTDESMPIVDLASEAEARWFESLFVPEKTHPSASRTGEPRLAAPYPGRVTGSTPIRSIHATGNEHTRVGDAERHQVRDD